MSMKEIKLSSGSVIQFTDPPAPFAESKALYQEICKELVKVKIKEKEDHLNLIKDIICVGLSSPDIEAKLTPCMGRVLYNGQKITADTFEGTKGREDYLDVCYEVIQENIRPFMKNLYAQFSPLLESVKSSLA